MAGPEEKRRGTKAGRNATEAALSPRRQAAVQAEMPAVLIAEADGYGRSADADSQQWPAQVELEVEMVVLRMDVGIIFHLGSLQGAVRFGYKRDWWPIS